MRIFLSHASEDKPAAEKVHLALLAANHEIFFDEASLPPGGDYNSRIRNAIGESEYFIFLISPNALEANSYTLTELELARKKWPRPWGAILPVMLHSVQWSSVPAYLGAVTVLEPKGNPAAEIAAHVDHIVSAEPAVTNEAVISGEVRQIRKLLARNGTESLHRFMDFAKQYCSNSCVRRAVVLAKRYEALVGDQSAPVSSESEQVRTWIEDYLAAIADCEQQAMIPKKYHRLLEMPQNMLEGALDSNQIIARWRHKAEREGAVVCRVEGIGKRFKRSRFHLQDISLEVEPGEIMAIVGMNASGKSTLMNIMAGVMAPDEGSVTYPALGNLKPGEEARTQISYVRQTLPTWSGTLIDNLRVAGSAAGIYGAENELFVDFLLHRYDLTSYANLRWSNLSGGYRLRFALALALVTRPKLLILDEPLANLDYIAQQRVLGDIRIVANSLDDPIPIIASSQHLYEIEQIATHVVMLDRGKIAVSEDMAKLRTDATEFVYEVHFIGTPPDAFFDKLRQNLSEVTVDHTFGGFICAIPKDTGLKDNFLALCSEHADELQLLRDHTGSARRLFREKIIGYNDETGFQTHDARR